MKSRYGKHKKVSPEFDYHLLEEHIAKPDTPWWVKLRGINLLAKQREEFDRRRKK